MSGKYAPEPIVAIETMKPTPPAPRRNVRVAAAEITPSPQTNGMNARSTADAGNTPER